jgi:hypothetical protein
MEEYQILIKRLEQNAPESYAYSAGCHIATDVGDTKAEAIGNLITYLCERGKPFVVRTIVDTTR